MQIGCEHTLDATQFLWLPEALQYEVLRAEICRIKGDLLDITFDQTQGVINATHAGGDFTITLPPGDIYATRKSDALRVWKQQPLQQIAPFDCPLQVPGVTRVSEVGLMIECSMTEHPKAEPLPKNEALIDTSSIVGPLRVRNVLPGDRIIPLGMAGGKKLQDIFVDKKIPKRERARAAVVCDDEKILWVVGVVTSERAKVTQDTVEAIRLTAERDR